MRKIAACLSSLLLCCGLLCAQQKDMTLKFPSNGELKILQLTDLHLHPRMLPENNKTFQTIDYLVQTEKPDFIALTGDLLWGTPAEVVLRQLLDRLDGYGIPYSIVYGNHDREQNLSEKDMSEIISAARGSINPLSADGKLADVRIPVLASDGSGVERADLYMMDSHDYTPIKGVGRYGTFTADQVQWLRSECEQATSRNCGVNVPSLAFFHIPLPEYRRLWDLKGFKLVGIRGEDVACSELNTGMFEAMRTTGNVFGCFCGHDHDSDFVANFCNIALGYGRYTGSNTVYSHLRHGARVIVLSEGKRFFRSWIREIDGNVAFEVRFDGSHLETKDNILDYGHVPAFKDDFFWENDFICCRAYGKAMEGETLSPGIDIWNKIPGRLVAREWYSHMTAEGGDKIYYHHAPDGKDCYKVGKSLGAGTSLPVIDGKLQFPATNWRESKIVKKSKRRVVFELVYPEWEGDGGVKFALTRRITFYSHSHFYKIQDTYSVTGAPNGLQVAVGIRNADGLKGAPSKGWPRMDKDGMMAFWTAATDQSVQKEDAMLGTAVMLDPSLQGRPSRMTLTKDKKNWVYTLPLHDGDTITYYSGNCWSKGDIKSAQQWFDHVAQQAAMVFYSEQ